ncbi:hypothetical protein WJX82_004158 [Trebouxia sp. C0006]
MGFRSALASGFRKVKGAVFERPSNNRTVFKVKFGTRQKSKHQSALTTRRSPSTANALDDSFYEEASRLAHYAAGVPIDYQDENRPLIQATMQLAKLLPHIEVVLQTARMVPVATSPCLEDTLVLLAEAHALPNACLQLKRSISRIMNQWALMPIPVENDIVVWSDEPQPARIGSNSREVVLLGVEPAYNAPQENAADEFISRAEAEKAVAEAVAAAVRKEREDADKMIKVLTRRPNDKWMVIIPQSMGRELSIPFFF